MSFDIRNVNPHAGYYISLKSISQYKYILIFLIFSEWAIYTIYNDGGEYMDYIEWFYNRLTELRIQKGVSARDMSLSLGQSESYINKIENRRTLPSFTGFIYICEYFEITPQEFFDINAAAPKKTKELLQELEKLSPEQTDHILQVVKDLNKKK